MPLTGSSLDAAVAANTTHVAGDGSDHADVATNTTHGGSDGSDHSFIDQDVRSAAAPVLAVTNMTGSAAGIDSDATTHAASTSDPHAISQAQAGAASTWSNDLPEDPGNTVFREMRVRAAGLRIADVAVHCTTLGASAAGTYLFDVLVNGSTVLTATINLETLVAGTWSTGTVLSDGTEDLNVGDEIRVQAVSNNGDLTGYDDGLDFSIGFDTQ